jgi:pimeloyl-ACP methyl ester carboxylesterase
MHARNSDRTLTMPDGRTVGFTEYGAPDGLAVLWCHGGPGSRREPEYAAAAAARAGFRLIGIDRPGYGLSTMQPGRTIGGWVDDAVAVADALGLEAFATAGVSTGGAYALAAASRCDRVVAAVPCAAVTDMRCPEARATLTSPAPVWNAPTREAACAVVAAQFGVRGEKMNGEIGAMGIPPSDAALFAEPRFAAIWRDNTVEMFAQGVDGYTDDRLADGGGWHSFDVARIACPVAVLHGTADRLVPMSHALHTRSLVPGARLELKEGLGHFSIMLEVVPTLQALLAERRTVRRAS